MEVIVLVVFVAPLLFLITFGGLIFKTLLAVGIIGMFLFAYRSIILEWLARLSKRPIQKSLLVVAGFCFLAGTFWTGASNNILELQESIHADWHTFTKDLKDCADRRDRLEFEDSPKR